MLEMIVVVVVLPSSTRNAGTRKSENEQDHYPSKNTPFQCVIVSILHLQKCVEEHIVSTKYSCPDCMKGLSSNMEITQATTPDKKALDTPGSLEQAISAIFRRKPPSGHMVFVRKPAGLGALTDNIMDKVVTTVGVKEG